MLLLSKLRLYERDVREGGIPSLSILRAALSHQVACRFAGQEREGGCSTVRHCSTGAHNRMKYS